MITSGGDREKRPTRILRALRQSPAGLSTPQIVAELAEGIEPPEKALTWYGGILRRQQEAGDVERAGRTPGAWQQCPAIIWRLTGSGEKLLACIDEAPVRKAEQERLAADAGRWRRTGSARPPGPIRPGTGRDGDGRRSPVPRAARQARAARAVSV